MPSKRRKRFGGMYFGVKGGRKGRKNVSKMGWENGGTWLHIERQWTLYVYIFIFLVQ
jgi:hypothetical protein